MPPADSTTGLVCYPRSFSALGDQRAEILPVQRPPALAVGARYMLRLAQILIFPFFPLGIMDQLPVNRGTFRNACWLRRRAHSVVRARAATVTNPILLSPILPAALAAPMLVLHHLHRQDRLFCSWQHTAP